MNELYGYDILKYACLPKYCFSHKPSYINIPCLITRINLKIVKKYIKKLLFNHKIMLTALNTLINY